MSIMGEKYLLLGDEAIAQGALDAGISGAYAYPGTPSTEILEYIQQAPMAKERDIHREWSSNEKTAMEAALGMSYAGKRVLVCMKHVGLNVAADPFVNSAITGANGGIVVVVADDPSMHSSQNEQDSRYYAEFAGIPFVEPAGQQEAYDMMLHCFALSEEMKLPVLMRITTRLAHSRADIVRKPAQAEKEVHLPDDARQFTLLPANARRNYLALTEKQGELENAAESSIYNFYSEGQDRTRGILVTGLAGNYLREITDRHTLNHPVLHIRQYPVPSALVRKLHDSCEEILVLEEGMPFLEQKLRTLIPGPKPVHGRLDGSLPRTGELNPNLVERALGLNVDTPYAASDTLKPRPPQLCRGCPHIDSYYFLNEALADRPGARVFSDIGCYTLGALPPFEAIHTCVDMGASITMAKGGADAGIDPSVAVIGDSTFTHSGMTGLLDAVYENTSMTILILDNDTTGMTGQQESMASGRLQQLCKGIGVEPEHVITVVPLKKNHAENVAILKTELDYNGVSVIIADRACIHVKRRV
jgi:indolepyruvate ferredoxin oxidoreductase alpha subunit